MGAQHTPMTQDDHAAALGFITTLSEHLLSQDPEANPQEEPGMQAPESGSQINSSGGQAMVKDEEQDKEIQDIRAELVKLQQDDGKTAKDTATPQ